MSERSDVYAYFWVEGYAAHPTTYLLAFGSAIKEPRTATSAFAQTCPCTSAWIPLQQFGSGSRRSGEFAGIAGCIGTSSTSLSAFG